MTTYNVSGIFQDSAKSEPWRVDNSGFQFSIEEAKKVANSYIKAGYRILSMWISRIDYDDENNIVNREIVWHECYLDVLGYLHMKEII